MVKQAIKIFNPRDKPFGGLSNDYNHLMQLDNKDWANVTTYIYSMLLSTPAHRQTIRSFKNLKKIRGQFLELVEIENIEVIRNALEKGLRVKFKKDTELSEKILATGNSPILYASENKLLGIGVDNKGYNLYGKYLSQMRHILRVSFRKQKDETVYGRKGSTYL